MHDRELEVALEAVRLAGTHLVEAYARFRAIPNAPANITTDADRQSQEIILQHILANFPNDALCAEEATATLASRPHVGARLWIVDPIDGTRGFAQKNDEFSVMVGFVRLPAGADLRPATKGLPDDLCPCPHWGYMLEGRVRMHHDLVGAKREIALRP